MSKFNSTIKNVDFLKYRKMSLKGYKFCYDNISMSSSYQFAKMSLQSLEEDYDEVCHNYLSYSAISAIVSGKGALYRS